MINYLKGNYECHLAAGAGSLVNLLNGQNIMTSVVVGVMVFIITSALKLLFQAITHKKLP